MKMIQRILKTLSVLMVVGLVLLPSSFTFATNADRELTDRENAAFIVRDEWTAWVKGFTASLSELDKNATSRIYTNMDYYDMQYRFTEKYKKVPEYLDEDGKPTQKLKDLIKEKRKEINGATTREFLCFTSNANGSKVKYIQNGTVSINIGYSTDGSSFATWASNTDITLNAGESMYVWNKTNTLSGSGSNNIRFVMSGSIEASGSVDSMINFSSITPHCYNQLFEDCTVLTKAPELPSTTLKDSCYSRMFKGCTGLIDGPSVLPATNVPANAYVMMFEGCNNLKNAPTIKANIVGNTSCQQMFKDCSHLEKAPELPATTVGQNCYESMFYGCSALTDAPSELPAITLSQDCYASMFSGCTNMQVAPHIKAKTLALRALNSMFNQCTSLREVAIDYTGPFENANPNPGFNYWLANAANNGTLYYSVTSTDATDISYIGLNGKGWTITPNP